MPAPLNKEHLGNQLEQLFAKREFCNESTAKGEFKEKKESKLPFGSNPPEAVIFTSNSLRKALMLYWSLIAQYDIHDWPSFVSGIPYFPEELTTAASVVSYFEKHIHNGDGTVRYPFLIGYLPEGVPFYLCPTDGETKGNDDPLQEARNKIDDVRALFTGKDVIFFSSDAVQDIRTAPSKLGKPMNLPAYEEAVVAGRVDEFKLEYLQQFYISPDGQPLHDSHVTGMVVERGTKVYEEVIRLSIEVHAWLLEFVEIHLQMGGGGVFQQFLHILAQHEECIWLELQNEDLRQYLESTHKDYWPFVVIFHIMGVPAWKVMAAFAHVS